MDSKLASTFVILLFLGIAQAMSGGTAVGSNERLYQTLIISGTGRMCNGVILTKNKLITTKPCVTGYNKGIKLDLKVNTLQRDDTVGIESALCHDKYDVCIVTLEKDLDYGTNGGPLALRSVRVEEGTQCTVRSWYQVINGFSLHSLNVYTLASTHCAATLATEICAGPTTETGGGLCSRDLGAPLVCGGELTGIAITEQGCYTGNMGNDKYLDISVVREWLIKNSAVSIIFSPIMLVSTTIAVLKAGF